MAKIVKDPSGAIWEERDGRWYEVTGPRAGGILAAQGMGLGEKLLVGAGREFERLGSGIGALIGTDKDRERIAAREAEASERIAGSKAAGAGAIGVGEFLPQLATLPLGGGVGGLAARALGRTATEGLAARLGFNAANVAPRGLAGLGEQAAISGVTGGIGYSGDQGMDAMTGALLAAGGFGVGQLAGKVVGLIGQQGAAKRAAMVAEDEARRARAGVMGPPAPGAGQGSVMGPPAPPENIQFGSAVAGTPEEFAARAPGAHPGAPGLTGEEQRQLTRYEELGFKVTPGMRTGSLPQLQWEAGKARTPWSAGEFEKMGKHNRDRLNELAVRAIGEDVGTELGPAVIGQAHRRIGKVFEDAAERVGTVSAADEVLQGAQERLRAIAVEATQGGVVVPEVGALAKKLSKVWEGGVTGERLLYERSRLVKQARDMKALPAEGVHQIIGVIDDVITDALPKGSQAGLKEARAQWRILRAMESGRAIDPGGNVRAGSLFEGLNREFPVEMQRGVAASGFGGTATGARSRDLMDAVRATQTLRNPIPNSGTATGMAVQGLQGNLLEQLLQGAVSHTVGRLYMGAPGRLGSELAVAPNAAPGLGSAFGGLGRGFTGGGLLSGF